MIMLYNFTQIKCQKCYKTISFEPGVRENLDFKCDCKEEPKKAAAKKEAAEKKAVEMTDRPNLGLCPACHETAQPEYLRSPAVERELTGPYFNRVVIPGEIIDTSAN